MSNHSEFLWYIPNDIKAGHRGDAGSPDHNSLDTLTTQAKALEEHGWKGALIGTGWGRPDTFTLATALVARTTSFEPLIAVRPGYWKPANFASSAATLDHLSGGRVRVNVVSGPDELAAYGDEEGDQAQRYARTKEFMRLVRRLWTEENVTFSGEHFHVTGSTVAPRLIPVGERPHPKLYFGGASEAAERVSATEADVQLFWGETLDGVRERIDRLKALGKTLDRDLSPLEFGLRITTFVRDTTEQAWAEAEAKVAKMADGAAGNWQDHRHGIAVGQQRLLNLAQQGDVLDDNLYTAPGKLAVAVQAPPGSSAQPRMSRARCANMKRSASAISCCPTRPISLKSNAKAANCFRSSLDRNCSAIGQIHRGIFWKVTRHHSLVAQDL